MSAHSLGNISDRPQTAMEKKQALLAGPVASPIITPPSSRQPADETMENDNLTQKTKSICSDDPAPPSSEIFTHVIPPTSKFDLEAYPSIFVPVNLLRLVEGAKDLDKLRSLAQVFATCLKTIIHSMDGLPYDVRLHPTYELAQYGVEFAGGLFATHVTKINPDWHEAKLAERIKMALELMDIAIASLRNFLEVAERILLGTKPLPALPTEDSAESLPPEARPVSGTLVNIVAEVLQTTESTPVTTSLEPVDTSHKQPLFKSNPTCKASRRKDSIIRRILQRTSNVNDSFLSTKMESTSTLVAPTLSVTSFRTINERPAPPGLPYTLRQSAVYFLADPYAPEVDVEMPLPTGDTVAVRLDSLGMQKAASITALVRMLTSKDAVTNPEFTITFFTFFRSFSSPMQFFELLVERFDEEPPTSLTAAQSRIWTREKLHVQIRVCKTIRKWLTEYWKPESDNVVLEHLRAFTLDRVVGKLPDQLVTQILEGLGDLVKGKEHCGIRRKRQLEISTCLATVEEPKPTGFLLDPESTLQFSMFESKAGQEELVRQLTIKASELYVKIDPVETILCWETEEVHSKTQAISSFERSIGFWITSTILDQLTPRKRADVIEFWLDLSTICIRLRNFSAAFAIYAGIANQAIDRMRRTIVHVSKHRKEKYLKLTQLFCGGNNFIAYRNVLAESHMPAVPAIAPFLRDIVMAQEVPLAIGATDGSKNKNLIHLYAYRILMKTVRAMEACLIPYKFTSNGHIQSWLDREIKPFHPDLEAKLADDFYEKSKALEARDPLLVKHPPWPTIPPYGRVQ